MKEYFIHYISNLYHGIPDYVYKGLLSIFVISVVALFFLYGKKTSWRKVVLLLLVEYVILIYCSTVFIRLTIESNQHYITPFWSYVRYFQGGRDDLIAEIIMNILVFLPVGFLLGCAFKSFKCRHVLMFGLALSSSIETLQLFLNRGVAEVDDIINNTVGCLIGFSMYQLLLCAIKLLKNKLNLCSV